DVDLVLHQDLVGVGGAPDVAFQLLVHSRADPRLQSEPVPCCGAVAHRSVLRVLARQSQPQAVVAGRTEFARPHRLLLIAVRLHGDGVHHHLLDRKAVLTAQFVTSQKCPAPAYKGLVGAGRVPWRRSHHSTRAPGYGKPWHRRVSSTSTDYLASSLVLT